MSAAPEIIAPPLAGVRVIELGTVVAGPFCGSVLADFGAEVIKVEQPGAGDPHRKMGYEKEDVPVWWGVDVREKQCVTLNLKTPEGKALLLKLVETADVLIENYRPGVLARLGLDWPVLSAANPRLVMLSITGFGETGPKALQPGFGKIAEGMSGIVPLVGTTVEDAVFVGFSLGDASAAMFGFFAIQLALYERDLGGGKGAHIDLALYEGLFRLLDCQLALAGAQQTEAGARQPNNPYAWGVPGALEERFVTLRCGDGDWLAVMLPDAAVAARVSKDLLGGARATDEALAGWAAARVADEATAGLTAAGAEVAPVFDGLSMARNPYFQARNDVLPVATSVGTLTVPGPYPKHPGHIAEMTRFRPAAVGADNDAVFAREAGLSAAEVQTLHEKGVL